MSSLSIADRVGGLVLAGFHGTSASEAPVEFVKGLAGTILFARNMESASQVERLVSELQAKAAADGAPPLVIAIDEEGGTVSRLAGIGTTLPSAMALGAAGDLAVTASAYRIIGEELAALGVTLDFAPVADVNTNRENPVIGVRSFGDDARRVGEHVEAAIHSLHEADVAAAAKHFPGHGATSVDSHLALPVIERDLADLRDLELVPFRAAMAAGVDAVMTAHVVLPRIDPSGAPATLSRAILTGLLREELGFDGVICTDCLQMNAIAGSNRAGESAVAAIGAGADLVAFSSSIDSAREAVDALREAIRIGRLDAEQIGRSLARVERLRMRPRGRRAGDIAEVGGEEHRRAALDVARRAVTIVRDPVSLLPLQIRSGQKIFLVQFAGTSATPAQTRGKQSTRFGKMLANGPARVVEQIRSLDPAGHEYKQLLMAAGSADAVIAVARRAWAHPLQARAVADLALAGKPLIVVAAREPYDAAAAPPDAAVIATYGDDDASMEAAAEVLLGTLRATGQPPVSLSEAGPSAPVGAAP